MGMDPVTLALVGTMAGAAVMEGYAAKEQAETEAKIAEMEAQASEREAKQIEAQGKLEQLQMAKEHAAGESVLLASISGAGAVPTTGVGLAVQAAQKVENEFGRLVKNWEVQENIKTKMYEAEVHRYEAKLAKRRGRAAVITGFAKAGATIAMAGYQQGWGSGGTTSTTHAGYDSMPIRSSNITAMEQSQYRAGGALSIRR